MTCGTQPISRAIVEAEQADLLARKITIDAGQREDRLAELDAELARAWADGIRRHFLDPIDDREAHGPTRSVETAEKQDRRSSADTEAGASAMRDGRSSISSLTPSTWADARRVEQEDRAPVVGKRGSGMRPVAMTAGAAGFTTSSS